MQSIIPSFDVRWPVPRVLALAIVLLCGACRDGAGVERQELVPAARDSSAAFQTDLLGYSLRATSTSYEGSIGFTFTNPIDGPVYIVNCNGSTGLRLEKLVASRWTMAYSPIIPACLSQPIVIRAGSQYRGVVYVHAGYPGSNVHPKFSVPAIPGTYRIVWSDAVQSYDLRIPTWSDPLPERLRTSNRFSLTTQAR